MHICVVSCRCREKFATRANSKIVVTVRNLAQTEGWQLQAAVDEALADQFVHYGGVAGARDLGLRKSARYRPRTGYYAVLIEEAEALWKSLAQNHFFIDGCVRTVFAVTRTFLTINGWRITAEALATCDL